MKRLLICLFLASPLLCLSQSNYLKGYVITNTKEKLEGYVNFEGGPFTPSEIRFKKDLTMAPQTFTVENCQGYGIEKKADFKRFSVSLSQSHTRISALKEGLDTTTKRGTVFLKLLQEGKNLTLFSYTDEIKERFYLLNKRSREPYELFRALFLAKHSATVTGNFKFRDQLMAELTNNEGVGAYDPLDLNTLRYEEKDLLNVVSAINDQKPPKTKISHIKIFAGTGLSISNASYKGQHVLANDEAVTTPSYDPVLTAGFDIFMDPAMMRYTLRVGVSLYTSKNKIVSTGNSRHRFDQKSIGLEPQFIYSFYSRDRFRLFVGIGAGIYHSSYSNNKPGRFFPPAVPGGEEGFELQPVDFNPFNITALGRIGAVAGKRIEISLGYIIPSALTSFSAYNVQIRRTTFGVNYLFGSY
jgi:hypothetical protein